MKVVSVDLLSRPSIKQSAGLPLPHFSAPLSETCVTVAYQIRNVEVDRTPADWMVADSERAEL